jgi:hypothetical protein
MARYVGSTQRISFRVLDCKGNRNPSQAETTTYTRPGGSLRRWVTDTARMRPHSGLRRSTESSGCSRWARRRTC